MSFFSDAIKNPTRKKRQKPALFPAIFQPNLSQILAEKWPENVDFYVF